VILHAKLKAWKIGVDNLKRVMPSQLQVYSENNYTCSEEKKIVPVIEPFN
jgi:hypothetical protein